MVLAASMIRKLVNMSILIKPNIGKGNVGMSDPTQKLCLTDSQIGEERYFDGNFSWGYMERCEYTESCSTSR